MRTSRPTLALEVGLNDLLLDAQTPIELDDKRRLAPRVNFNKIEFGARWPRANTAGAPTWPTSGSSARKSHCRRRRACRKQAEGGDDSAAVYGPGAGHRHRGAGELAMLAEGLPMPGAAGCMSAIPKVPCVRPLRWSGSDDFDVAASVDDWAGMRSTRCPVSRRQRHRARRPAGADDRSAGRNELSVDVPHVFRRSLDFSEFAGHVAAYRTDSAWRIETDAVRSKARATAANCAARSICPTAAAAR